MSRREWSLLYRLYCDRGQYTHGHSASALAAYYDSTQAGKALRREFGYRRPYAILDALYALPVPKLDLWRSRSCLFDFYTHNGERLVRTGWLRDCDLQGEGKRDRKM